MVLPKMGFADAPYPGRDESEDGTAPAQIPDADDAAFPFDLAFAVAPTGQALVGPDHRFACVNAAFCRMTQRSAHEFSTLRLEDIAHPDDAEELTRVLAHLRANPSDSSQVGVRYLRRGGDVLDAEVDVRALRGPDDHPSGFLVTIEDTTRSTRAEAALEERDRHYRAVIELSQDGFLVADAMGRLIEVNEAYLAFSGYSRDEILRMSVADIEGQATPDEIGRRLGTIAREGGDLFSTLHRAKSGRLWQAEINITYWPISGGRYFAFVRDVHRRQRSEMLLKARLELSEMAGRASLGELSQSALDIAERFTGSQVAFFHFVEPDQENLTLQAWSTNTLRNMCSINARGQHYPISQAGIWVDCVRDGAAVICNDYAKAARRRGLPDGHAPVTRFVSVPVARDGDVVAIIGVGNKPENYTSEDAETLEDLASIIIDVVEKKRAEERVTHLAYHDALTQLPNRTLLTDRLNQAMAGARRSRRKLAVCYLDLDGFKPINDRWGHAQGDRVLIEVGRRLKKCVRSADTVARLGGDEFVLLLDNLADVTECKHALDRVIDALKAPFSVGKDLVPLKVSLGVTLYPDDESDPDTLLRHVDQSMYAAKQAGGDRYHFFDAEGDRRAKTDREFLRRVESGLEAGEFHLLFQPKVDMRRGIVIGAEALVRWAHPDEGTLAPVRFLPALGASPVAVRFDQWVVRAALAQMSTWVDAGLVLPVSVNLSARFLQQRDLLRWLQVQLEAHPKLQAESLELEILETAALEDMPAVSEIMASCRSLGVRFALDDFGTGYSSLSYLRRLPAHRLKIDQSFVRDMLVDEEALAIVAGVIGLSEAFHLSVIAEGVETIEHGRMLLDLGCELAQGYGIARPMPPEEIPGWIARWVPPLEWSQVADVQVL